MSGWNEKERCSKAGGKIGPITWTSQCNLNQVLLKLRNYVEEHFGSFANSLIQFRVSLDSRHSYNTSNKKNIVFANEV